MPVGSENKSTTSHLPVSVLGVTARDSSCRSLVKTDRRPLSCLLSGSFQVPATKGGVPQPGQVLSISHREL